MRLQDRFTSYNEIATRVGAIGVAIAILCLFLITVADVLMRWTFDSIPGAIDIATYLMAPIAFLGLGYGQLRGIHVRVDFILLRFPRKLQNGVEIFNLLLMIAVLILFTWLVIKVGIEEWQRGTVHYGTIEFPDWIRYLMALIGCTGLMLAFVTQLVRRLGGPTEGGA